MLKVMTIVTGALGENCYIAYSQQNNCVVIDPGAEGERIVKIIKENMLHPLAILLTHGHFDHIGGVEALQAAFDVPLYIHRLDVPMLEHPEAYDAFGLITQPPLQADHLTENGEVLSFDDTLQFSVLHTPGHTPGSCIYRCQDILFTGDTLFRGTVGRCDLPGGNLRDMLTSIKHVLLPLADDLQVLPGHDDATTIGLEKRTNPYFQGE